jgi:hypothetical protein
MIYIGIDNGITGGLVALSDRPGPPIAMIKTPSKRWRRRNEIDIRSIHRWISDVTSGNLSNAFYTVEEPNNSRNASTAYSVASSFHSLRGFFDAKFLDFDRITPQSWQKRMLGKFETGQSKKAALAKARELWPDEKWLASPRCSTPHEGMIDAALIAEFSRIK